MKLSEAQRRVLERMATGDEIWTTNGRQASCWFRSDLNARPSPGLNVLFALTRRKLVEECDRKLFGARYRITEAGRAALGNTP